MTRIHTIGFTVVLILVGMLAACALDSGKPGSDEMGYQKCETDEDCETGVCIESDDFNYCGTECTINDDCKPLECGTGFVMACKLWRCEATEKPIPSSTICETPEDGDEPEDGDAPVDGDGSEDGDGDEDTEDAEDAEDGDE